MGAAPIADGAAPIADADRSAPSRGVLAGQTLETQVLGLT
jgi:hypothetical protein